MTASKQLDLAQFDGHTPGPNLMRGLNLMFAQHETFHDVLDYIKLVESERTALLTECKRLQAEGQSQRTRIEYLEVSLKRRDDDLRAALAKVSP